MKKELYYLWNPRSRHNFFVHNLRNTFGSAGYVFLLMTLELISGEGTACSIHIKWVEYSKELGMEKADILKMLDYCRNLPPDPSDQIRMTYRDDGEGVYIAVPRNTEIYQINPHLENYETGTYLRLHQ